MSDDPSAFKRRKVRKGTVSCWECRRRKIRCTFISAVNASCDGCRSRQVKCVSQEFYNEIPVATGVSAEWSTSHPETGLPRLTPRFKCHEKVQTVVSPRPSIATHDRYHDLCTSLFAAWPKQHEFDAITNVAVGTSVLFHGTVCQPYSRLFDMDMPSARELLQLPSSQSHPVLIARKLLMLGSFIQGIPQPAVKELQRLETNHRAIMSRVMDTASKLVTCNDDLINSLEGIECIMIESMYHNNGGNLRRAWLMNRRAIAMAQMMGLHSGNTSASNMIDLETRKRIEPSHMWFRLIATDRYLSLMLGLPQAYQGNWLTHSKVFEDCSSVDRLERTEVIVGGLILQRNGQNFHDSERTDGIDKILQDTAASMPAQWWLIPDVTKIAGSDTKAFSETIRIMNQLVHYHLVLRLHLPYMLQSSYNQDRDYSKMTAISASREILSRFVHLRSSEMIVSYCRGSDFLAFIASTTLCVGYIDFRNRGDTATSKCADVFRSLKHQRPADRGLMERTLQIMEHMAQDDGDAIACRIADMLSRLLSIESNVADGRSCTVSLSFEHGGQGVLDDIDASDNGDGTVKINIPHIGIIKVERDDVARHGEQVCHCREDTWSGSTLESQSSGPVPALDSRAPSERVAQWSGQGFQSSLPLFSGPQHEFDSIPSHQDSIDRVRQPQAVYTDRGDMNFNVDDVNTEDFMFSDPDDWTLQGVDLALFSTLFGAQ